MKTIIFTVLMLAAVSSHAQVKYDTCQYLQQYEGNWKSVNGQDTIRIMFRYHRDYSASMEYVKDVLYGWFEYKQGNNIIAGDYSHRLDPLNYNYDSRFANVGSVWLHLKECNNSSDLLKGTMQDRVYGQILEIKATLDPTKTIMTWHQDNPEMYGQHQMTLPRDFVLTKY